MRGRIVLGAAAIATAGLALPAVADSPHPAPGSRSTTDARQTCGDDGDYVSYSGPTLLWPPNHKLSAPASVTAVGDTDDEIDLTITVSSDQLVDTPGSGNTTDFDYQPVLPVTESGTGTVSIGGITFRSERAGGDQTGRTYTVRVDVDFGNGDECTLDNPLSYRVEVPHDMRPANRGA